ncbi:MAG: murein transglycosylase A [Cyanobacteria bacterium J06621_8]
MKKFIFTCSLGLSLATLISWGHAVNGVPLQAISPSEVSDLELGDQLLKESSITSEEKSEQTAVYRWHTNPQCSSASSPVSLSGWDEPERQALLTAVDHSLKYLSTPKAKTSYRQLASKEFSWQRVKRSLLRFKELLLTSDSPATFEQAVRSEFVFYQSVGTDNQGTVEFTGYFEPSYTASRVPTQEYRYPLYRQPSDFQQWSKPHPTRAQLEGLDGLSSKQGKLKGQELVWLRDRLEAYLIQVQGSARLRLTDGSIMTVGYGGTTDYPYVSIGKELVEDGIFNEDELSLPRILRYFAANPQQLDQYLPRNNRFIFFRETAGNPPTGSLGVPVTGDRSIATDKSLMPPGALALIMAPIPDVQSSQENSPSKTPIVSRYVLDQDTGSAIRGAGRVDIFLGSGEVAGARAGLINGEGQLFYLLLKDK